MIFICQYLSVGNQSLYYQRAGALLSALVLISKSGNIWVGKLLASVTTFVTNYKHLKYKLA